MTKQPDPIPPEGMPPSLTEGFLTAKEAAERLGLSVETVRAMCSDGVLPGAVRDHDKGSWRIPVQAVETWLARQNNTPQPKTVPTSAALPPTRFWRLIVMIGAIVGILGLVSVIANSLNVGDRWRVAHATPTPLPFERAKADETLILIASFDHTEGVADTDIQHEIHRAITQAVDESQTSSLRVEVEPIHLKADDRSGAEALGKQYNASIVIWGADTGVRVAVNFLNLRCPCADAAKAQINETQRTQIADPAAYASFVTHDLPSQLSFLSLFAIGQSYETQMAYEDSIRVIEKGIAALVPANEPPEGLAEAYFQLGWLHQILEHEQQAIDRYTEAIELNPQFADAYGNRGIAHTTQGDLDAAIRDFDKAIELDPHSACAYNNRGNARWDQDDLPGAIRDYDRAIELDSHLVLAYNNRGRAHYYQGELDTAIQDFDKAIVLNPQFFDSYRGRGLVRFAQNELTAAFQDFDQAITLNPFFARAYCERGFAYGAKGDLEAAMRDLNKAIELDPQLSVAYYNRGVILQAQNELDAAIQDYTKAIVLDPQDADPYNNRGVLLGAQNQLVAAILDFDKAIALKPQNAFAYNNRGLAYYKTGDLTAAIQDFDKAVGLNPRYVQATFNRGQARKDEGDLTGAIADFRRCLELSPNASDRQQIEQWIAELEQQLNKP